MVGIVSNQHPLYLETLFNACVIDSNTNLDSSAFALLGIIVSLRTRKSTKKSISTSALDRFEKKLFSMLTHVDITVNRALLFGELCSDPFYKISVNEEENEKLLYPLIDILFNNEGFLKSTESFFQDLYLLANKTALDTEINRSLTLKLESAQFKSLGRIAKAISTYMNHIMSSETDHYFFIYTIFSRMKLFVEELSHKWEKSGFGDLPSQEKAVNSISDGVWKYFKAILFTCLMLTDSYASFLQKQFLKRDSVSMDHYEDLKSTIQCILATLHSLHFITCKFGLGGLSLFDDQISIFSASILKICTQSSLNNYHTKLLESLFGQLTNECIVSNQAILSKQLFYLIIVRNLFDFVGNAYILNRILPFIKARLICPTHISRVSKTQNPIENLILDSVDLSHTIYLKLFDSSTLHRHLVRDHCLPYAHILLENFNHGVDLELLKEGFKGMIRGLSDFKEF
ncbi:hypothetical protein BC833DRAFT_144922 [Globomyces pollinis-pini]|nr:hypothetical protein BC833DRAFT_144922 [Globomyces pollinis-pini]